MTARPPKLPAPVTRAIARVRRDLALIDQAFDDYDLTFEQLARVLAELDRSGSHTPGLIQTASAVRDRALVEVRAEYPWPPGETQVTVAGVGVVAPSSKGKRTTWDGPALASKLAARVADEGFDRETGNMKPLGVVCNDVAQLIVKCAGLDTASQTWRAGELEQLGLDPDTYRTKSGGDPSVRFTD